jgi:hypothetical protein
MPSIWGPSLAGWKTELGDARYARSGERPVDSDDIQTAHYPSYSELCANIKRRIIMAHNITFYRIIDTTALQTVHTCGYKFSLPDRPRKDTNAGKNGETVEGGIFVWDGGKTQLDYGMAFQWVINPWSEQYGDLNAWNGTKWLPVGHLNPEAPATTWHEVKMKIDYPRQTTALYIDGQQYMSYFAIEQKEWIDPQIAARLQAEVVSIYPETSGLRATHCA